MSNIKPETTAEYVYRVGSELAIAFALDAKNKAFEKSERTLKAWRQVRKIVESNANPNDGDLWLDDEVEVAFTRLVEARQLKIQECNARLEEISRLGRIPAPNPTTDAMPSGYGLQRPSEEFLNQFFGEGD